MCHDQLKHPEKVRTPVHDVCSLVLQLSIECEKRDGTETDGGNEMKKDEADLFLFFSFQLVAIVGAFFFC